MFDKRQGGLKTDTSSITVGPSYLLDCSNVIFSKEDILQSRHGHQVRTAYVDYVNSQVNSTTSAVLTGLRPYTLVSGGTRNNVRAAGLFVDDSVNPPRKITLGQPQLVSGIHQNIQFMALSGGSFGATTLVEFGYTPNTLVNRYPVPFKYQQNYYFLSNKGLHWPSLGLSGVAGTTDVEEIQFPGLVDISATLSISSDNGDNFIIPGYKFGIAATVLLETSELNPAGGNSTVPNERYIESAPIFAEVDLNFVQPGTTNSNYRTATCTITLKNATTNKFVTYGRAKLRIYRTLQVPIYRTAKEDNESTSFSYDPLPTEYRQAAPDVTLTGSSNVVTVNLTTNDDGVLTLPELYTNPNIEGLEYANTHVRGAKNVTEYKNYYVYSNLNDPGLKTISLTSIVIDRRFGIYFKKNGESYQDIPSRRVTAVAVKQSNGSSAPGITSTTSYQASLGTSRSTYSYVGFGGPYQYFIYPNDKRGGVAPYAQITGGVFQTDGYQTITCTVPIGGTFDIDKFVTPGIAAVVSTYVSLPYTPAYSVSLLFSYKTVTPSWDGANRKITFGGCVAAHGTETTVPTLATASHIYYIPGESMSSLPVYISSGNPLQIDSANTGTLSLLPTIGNPSVPIGVIASDGANSAWSIPAPFPVQYVPVAKTAFLGVLKKSSAQLLDDSVKLLVRDLNIADANNDFTIKKTNNIGEFYITPNNQDYEFATFANTENTVGGSATFAPSVPNTFVDAATKDFIKSENFRNAIFISKINTPELISEALFLSPLEVGDRNEAIQATAANTNNIFILKDNSTWRLSISSQAINAEVDSLTVFDPTTGCVGGRSAKEINEEIIWLSPKGFVSIAGNSMEFIGRDVELEVKNAISLCQGAGLTERINAFANESKRLYGCFIPTSDNPLAGVTYVFDCYLRKWSKWDLPFEFAQVDKYGKLYTIQSFWDINDYRYSTLREDEFTSGNSTAVADQYDHEVSLAGATIDSISGNDVYISRSQTALVAWISPLSTAINGADAIGEACLPLVNKQAFYKIGSTLYPVTVYRQSAQQIWVAFASTPPITISSNISSHVLVVGVVATARYQPETGATPSSLKQYQEYHVHTSAGVHNLGIRYTTDSRSTYTAYREFTGYSANRTIYRAYLPVEASRGRFLIREVRHYYPYETFEITGQELISREIGSVRNQRS